MSNSAIVTDTTTDFSDFTFNYSPSIGFYEDIDDRRLNPIPTNTIIYKALTGIGATTAEIKSSRDSIIVLPNLPVIKGKQKDHVVPHNTLAVHEGITVDHIVSYLMRVDAKPKKILTTPESFALKVKKAMRRASINMYNEYFLLFDEAHKYILDNGYRKDIVTPFDDFFKFTRKAIISATPLRFSDPRFKQQGFVKATINPVYDIKKDINIIHTNNISHALKGIISAQPNQHYCIFYASIDGIKSVMQNLSIKEESRIFCSTFSTRELNIEGYKDVHSVFDPATGIKQYNFFTSSFYNGLDIKLDDIKPHLIMITSVKFADHSVIDPYTDAVQIIGRFRGGVSAITHITDTNENLYYLKPQEAVNHFNTSAEVYKAIQKLKLGAPNPFAQDLYKEALMRIKPYAELLKDSIPESTEDEADEEDSPNQSNEINYFKLDNYLHFHKVRSYYASFDCLIEAYHDTRRFNVTQEVIYLKVTKEDVLKRFGNRRTSPDVYRDVTNILNDLEGLKIRDPYEYNRQMLIYQEMFTPIVNAYEKLGIPRMEAMRFNHRAIQREVIKQDAIKGLNYHAVIDAVYNEIPKGSKMTSMRIKEILQSIYDTYIIKKQAKATDIEQFYKVRKNVKVKVMKKKQTEWHRGFEMQMPTFNVHNNYKRL